MYPGNPALHPPIPKQLPNRIPDPAQGCDQRQNVNGEHKRFDGFKLAGFYGVIENKHGKNGFTNRGINKSAPGLMRCVRGQIG